jgi:hypothetical protein
MPRDPGAYSQRPRGPGDIVSGIAFFECTGGRQMKYFLAPVIAAVLIAGCVYESPLTEEHVIAIDPSVPGVWEEIPEPGNEQIPQDRMLILKFSDTEYMVSYPMGAKSDYYRAYPINIGGVSCVQLQVIGTQKGPLEPKEKDQFLVASYVISDDILEISLLNTELVDDDIKNPESLRKAFLEHKNDKNLFVEPGRFKRIHNPE